MGKKNAIAAGYWEKPDVSKATFQAYTAGGQGPYLRTGDLGFMENGLLFITGRTKELIIIRGVNYYPQDIEEVVSESHPDIQPSATAAFSVETDQDETLMIMLIVPGKLPKTSSGKIQRLKARELFSKKSIVE